jgi:hypothetical protein
VTTVNVYDPMQLHQLKNKHGAKIKGKRLYPNGTLANGGFVVWLEIETSEGTCEIHHGEKMEDL